MPSGLRYRVLQPPRWNAPGPSRGDRVAIRYSGWLDESGACGQPLFYDTMMQFTIAHGDVIDGLDTGVLTMRKGEKRRLYIPAELAYGDRGSTSCVPPDADVIFDVELYDIQ